MKRQNWLSLALAVGAVLTLGQGQGFAADINVSNWAQVIAANPSPGDRVVFAPGTYTVTQQVELRSNVTYIGSGPGVVIDGGAALRAFTGYGNRGLYDGRPGNVDNVPDPMINTTGPKGWVLENLTIQNCRADANGRQDILSVARNLLTNIATAAGADGVYDATEAATQQGALNDNPTWFGLLAGDASLTQAELDAYLAANPPGSAGHLINRDGNNIDGGALIVLNGATGTIKDCNFLNNATIVGGGDGGAIQIAGIFTDITIDRCLFEGNTTGDLGDTGGAIRLESGRYEDNAASNLSISNSIFRNNTSPRAGQDGGAIRLGGELQTFSARNTLFENNSAADDGGCIFQGNNLPGLQVIENCVFVGNSAGDDDLVQFRGLSRTINCTFVNNNTLDQSIVGHQGQRQDGNNDGTFDTSNGAPDNVSLVANCIFVNNVYGDGDALLRGRLATVDGVANTVTATVVAINNIHFNNTSQPTGNANNVLVKSGHGTETGTLTVDPNINLTTWIPNTGSPAINAGSAAQAPADDFRGWTRVGVADIGALEFGATAPVGEGEGEGEGEPGPTGTEITSNVYPPFIDEGTTVILTAPTGTDYQWRKGAADIVGATNKTLVFDPVTEEDAGLYRVRYNDGAKAIVLSPPFNLIVKPEGSVPVAGLIGLVALAGACGLGGARLIRRRK